jgi:hypothetical protein
MLTYNNSISSFNDSHIMNVTLVTHYKHDVIQRVLHLTKLIKCMCIILTRVNAQFKSIVCLKKYCSG